VQALAGRSLIRPVRENLVGKAWKFISHRGDALIEFGPAPARDASLCCYVRDKRRWLRPRLRGQAVQAIPAAA